MKCNPRYISLAIIYFSCGLPDLPTQGLFYLDKLHVAIKLFFDLAVFKGLVISAFIYQPSELD
jgi:hypothetical protein